MKLLLILAVAALSASLVFPLVSRSVSSAYSASGEGDQSAVFAIVLASFLVPVATPLFVLKDLATWYLPSRLEAGATLSVGRWLLTPAGHFDSAATPPPPDYGEGRFWAARGRPSDSAQCFPPGSARPWAERPALAFYLSPTTWYTGASWQVP